MDTKIPQGNYEIHMSGPVLSESETLIEKIVDQIRAEPSTLKCIKILERFKEGNQETTIMKFFFGFTLDDVVYYGWHDKKLYRLPFTRLGREYGLKEIKPFQKVAVYNIQKNQMTIGKLKLLTKKFDVPKEIVIVKSDDCPFD